METCQNMFPEAFTRVCNIVQEEWQWSREAKTLFSLRRTVFTSPPLPHCEWPSFCISHLGWANVMIQSKYSTLWSRTSPLCVSRLPLVFPSKAAALMNILQEFRKQTLQKISWYYSIKADLYKSQLEICTLFWLIFLRCEQLDTVMGSNAKEKMCGTVRK